VINIYYPVTLLSNINKQKESYLKRYSGTKFMKNNPVVINI